MKYGSVRFRLLANWSWLYAAPPAVVRDVFVRALFSAAVMAALAPELSAETLDAQTLGAKTLGANPSEHRAQVLDALPGALVPRDAQNRLMALVASTIRPSAPAMHWKGKCSAPKDTVLFKSALPNLARVLGKGGPVRIIALGSSSTAGSGASSPLASYPARLDAELDRRFPTNDIHVDNQGAGGQLARDMLERIHSYIAALPEAPALVIWQTGVNDATQDVGLAEFSAYLERGILDLRSAGIDVILVDMQYYPRSERVAVYGDYLRTMHKVAEQHKVPVFQRFAIMKYLVKSGQHSAEQLLAPDNFHLNDLSYGCLADLMADAIEEQIKAGRLMASQLPTSR